MLGGMIEVHNLNGSWEMLGKQVPDPGGPIAHGDNPPAFPGMPALCRRPELLAKHGRILQGGQVFLVRELASARSVFGPVVMGIDAGHLDLMPAVTLGGLAPIHRQNQRLWRSLGRHWRGSGFEQFLSPRPGRFGDLPGGRRAHGNIQEPPEQITDALKSPFAGQKTGGFLHWSRPAMLAFQTQSLIQRVTPISGAAIDNNDRDSLPSWVTINPAPDTTFAATATTKGGDATWATLTLPDGEVGISGAVVDANTANNSNNTIRALALGPGTPSKFRFYVVTDNTAGQHDPASRLRARGERTGVFDISGPNTPPGLAASMNGSPDELAGLNDLPVRTVNGATVYLRDVAYVRDGFSPQTNIVRQDGVRGVLISVLKNGGASTLDIVSNILELLPRASQALPQDIRITPLFDQSVFVKAAVKGVAIEALVAALLTAAMVLLFLGCGCSARR